MLQFQASSKDIGEADVFKFYSFYLDAYRALVHSTAIFFLTCLKNLAASQYDEDYFPCLQKIKMLLNNVESSVC